MRLHPIVESSAILETNDFKVVTLKDHSNKISSVERKRDGKIFSIGDYVTNGTQMRGHITGFTQMLGEENGKVSMYAEHTWSGIGMHLDNLKDALLLPSKYQIGSEVDIRFGGFKVEYATVLKVHFTGTKEQYDLEIPISTDNVLKTRIYNVDGMMLSTYHQ